MSNEFTRPSVQAAEHDFVKKVWIVAGVATLTVVLIALVWAGREILLVTFAGILLGVFFRGAADLLSKYTGLSKGWALIAFVALSVLILGVGGFLLAPSVIKQTEQLISQLPESQQQIQAKLNESKLGQDFLSHWSANGWFSKLESTSGHILGMFSTSLGALSGLVLVFFVGLFLAASPKIYENGVVRLVPLAWRPRCRELLKSLGHTLRRWLLGQSVTMLFVGTMTAIGLWLLGIPVALPLALMAAILGFVPFFGPLVAAIPAIALAFLEGPSAAASVAGLYLVVQFLEGNVLTPLVQRETVSIPPAVSIVAIVLMGVLLGPLGMVLAMPLTAVLFVLVKELYVDNIEARDGVNRALPAS